MEFRKMKRTPQKAAFTVRKMQPKPRKSVVQVYFEARDLTLAYFNDSFDLHRGDIVYVDGKLEGMQGRVTEVNYNFKVSLSDYKRVIAVADTCVHSRFFMAGSHFVTFDRTALPDSKVITWFRAPLKDGDAFVSGSDGTSFLLGDPDGMKAGAAILERGRNYYLENRVSYISIDGTKGYAIVKGGKPYEVEFEYRDGEISGLVCPCFCSGSCKHEVAAMLQLKETLGLVQKHYAAKHARTGYFAAVDKNTLLTFAVDRKEAGTFTL